jgi:predicted dehydrogenase
VNEADSGFTAGVIGGGGIAEVAHLPGYTEHDAIDRVTLAEIQDDRRTELASEWGLDATYPTGSELFEEERPDIVSICTPPHTHEDLFVDATAFARAIYCEKPFAPTVEAARTMAEAAGEANVVTQIGYTHPYFENFRRVIEMVQNGVLGELLKLDTIRLRNPPSDAWHYDKEMAGGGAVFDLGPHELDFYMRLFDEPLTLERANLRCLGTSEVDDYGVVDLTADGTEIRLTLGWGQPANTRYPPPNLHREVLIGTNGWLEFDAERMEGKINGKAVEYRHGSLPVADLFGRYTWWDSPSEDVHGRRIRDFLDHVVRGDNTTNCPASRGVEVLETLDRIYEVSDP